MEQQKLLKLLFGFSMFIGGLGLMYWRYGITTDISHVYTKLQSPFWKLMFRLWYPLFVIPLVSVPVYDQLIWFKISCLLILGVPVFPDYWSKTSSKLHVIFAFGGLVNLLLSIIVTFQFGWFTLLVYGAIYGILKMKVKNKTYWAESLSATIAFISVLFWILFVNSDYVFHWVQAFFAVMPVGLYYLLQKSE